MSKYIARRRQVRGKEVKDYWSCWPCEFQIYQKIANHCNAQTTAAMVEHRLIGGEFVTNKFGTTFRLEDEHAKGHCRP